MVETQEESILMLKHTVFQNKVVKIIWLKTPNNSLVLIFKNVLIALQYKVIMSKVNQTVGLNLNIQFGRSRNTEPFQEPIK